MTDDNYCKFLRLKKADSLTSLVDVHYCEGSLMPILVNELIFTMIPQQSPFFIRPLMNVVFGQVKSKMTQPRMKIHADLVKSPSKCDLHVPLIVVFRSNHTSKSRATGLPGEKTLLPPIS